MLWDIVNPSDPYTMKGDDHLAVAVAVMFLGEGQYAANEIDGERQVPLFLFGGHEAWLQKTFDTTLEKALENNRLAIADALESVMIGSPSARRTYETALKHLPEEAHAGYRAEVLDQQRSSLNNIGKRAWGLARAIRGQS